MMTILQAGIYPKNYYVGLKGATKVPCAVCGSWFLQRLRVVRIGDSGQSVIHVCFRNMCIRSVFSLMSPVSAMKIRSNGAEMIHCLRCNRDARGGVAVLGLKTEFVKQAREDLCEICFFERITEATDTRDRIKANGGVD